MNVLIIGIIDDNFGDMLIRITFRELLRVALENLGIHEYSIKEADLKEVDEETISKADIILIGGGGMIDFSHLRLTEHLDTILEGADKYDIPVILSSVGIFYLEDYEKNREAASALLSHRCIKALSARENTETINKFLPDGAEPIPLVCDPAVWTKEIYSEDIKDVLESKKDRERPLIGINVVRGGLFKDHDIKWTRHNEKLFIESLITKLKERNMDYCLYTNGMSLDDNGLLSIADELELARDDTYIPQTSRELVRCIAGFDAIAAIRLHSSIVAYSLGVPSVNLVWNEKVTQFYENIDLGDRAIAINDNTDDTIAEKLCDIISETIPENSAYKMQLYEFIYKSVGKVLCKKFSYSPEEVYTYEEICKRLSRERYADDDALDLRIKVRNLERRYLSQFNEIKKCKDSLRITEANYGKLERKFDKQVEKNETLKEKNNTLKEKNSTLKENNDTLKQLNKELRSANDKMEKRLDRIDSTILMRSYHAIKGHGKADAAEKQKGSKK